METRQKLEEPTRYGSSPMFVAGATFNQNFPVGFSNVSLNTIPTNINDNGCFNPSSSSFVASKAGRMLLLAQMTVINTSSTASICSLLFVVDGTDVAPKLETVAGNFCNVTFSNSLILDVNVGTTVSLKFFNEASPDIRSRAFDWGALATSLQGFYLT